MGLRRGLGAPSLTSSDALLKESCEYRQRPLQVEVSDGRRARTRPRRRRRTKLEAEAALAASGVVVD